MNNSLGEIWVYLAASPLLWLALTLIAYLVGATLYQRSGGQALVNPVAIAIVLVVSCLMLTGTSYETYFEGAQFVHFLLGPATVALAVPLYQQMAKLRALWFPIAIGVGVGLTSGTLATLYLAKWFGASEATLMSLAPKSMTTPIAMAVSEKLGGIPSLTAVMVIATGIVGAVLGTHLFALFRIHDDSVKGVAMGLNAHGIGTARAFQVSPEMGAFAGLGMALMAFAGPLVVPWIVDLVVG